MKRKCWLIAAVIIGVLAFVFFLEGNQHTNTTKFEESTISQCLRDTASAVTEKEQQPDNYNVSADEAVAARDSAVPDMSVLSGKPGKKLNSSDSINRIEKKSENLKNKTSLKKVKQSDSKEKPHKENSGKKSQAVTGKKDKYLTDPVPEGRPKPVEWQNAAVDENKQLTCTLSVTCKTILNNMDSFNKDKLEVLPEDGIIFKAQKVTFSEGESVFDVLLREMKKNKIHMEFEMTPIYNSNYIEGINNLYEFDCGELSGWMYSVNGWFPNYGCSRYKLKDGDVVEWIYTCDLGRDIGGGEAIGEGKK